MKSSMKRRIFATALSLIMAAGLFFRTGIPARADENTLTISTNSDCKVIAVSPAEGIDGNLYYYDLTANVALTSNPDSIKIKELDGDYGATTYNMDMEADVSEEEVIGDKPLAIGPEFEFKTSYFTDDYSFIFEEGYDPASFDYSDCMGYFITDGSRNMYCVIVKCFPFPLPVKPETVELNFGSYSWDTDITDASGAWTFDSGNKILTINEGHTVTTKGTAPVDKIYKVSVKGTLAGDAVFNLRDAVENNGGTISGGIFECPVKNNGGTINGGIFRRAQNSRSHIYNYSGTISGGTFNDVAGITNYDTISGGTFSGSQSYKIDNSFGTISGGTFSDVVAVDNYGTISAGTFEKYVDNYGGIIKGGTFNDVDNNEGGIIEDGVFNGTVKNYKYNAKGAIIKGGTFNDIENDADSAISVDAGGKITIKGSIKNEGTITNNSGGKIIVESGGNIDNNGGTITNDGIVILPTDIDAKSLGMTGTGTIEQGGKKYKNDGTEIKPPTPEPTPTPTPDPNENSPQTYPILSDGTNTVFIAGQTWTFRSQGEFSNFDNKVTINEMTLTKDIDYTAKEGSTIVSLLPAFTSKMQPGNYTLTMYFKDGYTTSKTFEIQEAQVSNNTNTPKSPKTGEENNPYAWMILLISSLGVLALVRKKKDA